jgi:hypothetical protein
MMLKRAVLAHVGRERREPGSAQVRSVDNPPHNVDSAKRQRMSDLRQSRMGDRLIDKVSKGLWPATEAQRVASDIVHDYGNHSDIVSDFASVSGMHYGPAEYSLPPLTTFCPQCCARFCHLYTCNSNPAH